MGFDLYGGRYVFALMIIVTSFIILGHTLSSALHKPRYPRQLNSFQKLPFGVFCDQASLQHAADAEQILEQFEDYQFVNFALPF